MSKKLLIAPSVLSANFADLRKEIERVTKAGADMIHIDVMDGHFVPNITVGPCVVKAIAAVTGLPLNTHLMIEEPAKYLEAFAEAGSDRIIIHVESEGDVKGLIRKIKSLGKEAGVSIKPRTGISAVKDILGDVDEVLIMTVEPGFGGQGFIPETVPKIAELRKIYKGDIAVDGGINSETAKDVVKAGANILVAGTAVFGAKNVKDAIAQLRGL